MTSASPSVPSVLFVCVHNAGRSQMAAAFLTHLADERVQVRSAGSEPADQVLAIYQLGIDEGNATFVTTAPTGDAFDASHLLEHRFVALDDGGKALGWVAVVPVSDRCAYAGVVEHSVYVHPAARGWGI